MSHAGPEQPVSWVPNRKLTTAVVTNVLTTTVALAVTKLGLNESAAVAGWVSGGIGIVAGAVAGYIVKEVPVIEKRM